ncbi:DUF2190 family protein [Rhizobium sp. FY34]|uniref:DUF2190 family protein n=1 Tax=Rhizobium sp. FY34 TaxID=2562309 RepID=UPI0010C04B4A|nr:DUF2190 family protein [Rhizobium sp. FY34]
MKNFVQPGKTLDLTAPAGGIVSGQAALFGALFGVANFSAAEGQPVAVDVEGVFTLPKAVGALAEGVKAYWTGTQISGTASGNTLVGHIVKAAASDATSVQVRIAN